MLRELVDFSEPLRQQLWIICCSADASAVLEALPNSVSTPELNVACAEGEAHSLVAELVARASFDAPAQLNTIEKRLNQIAKTDAQVKRVQTINGVGRVTAEAIVAYIDDPHRFKSARQVGSYAGLVPRQYQSGCTDRRGRITKRGPRLLRTLLLECAWCSLRYNQWSQETYKRIHGDKRPRKKKAAIALARKILVIAWALMRDEVDYDPERNLAPDPDRKSETIPKAVA